MQTVKVEHLYKKFKLSKKQQKEKRLSSSDFFAVNDVCFSLNEGEIYGLLGPNGAGKTTTLRMLATLISPTSGDIYINGLDLKKKQEEIRGQIGFLTSELKLDNFFTPSYTFDFFAKLYSLDDSICQKRKNFLFNKFGIDEFKDKKIGELSTGMKQKVSLAISLLHDPKIIIFDEPTNGLDILSSKLVEDYLLDLKKENKTIIISTHIFSLVEKLCDRVGIIIEGKLIFDDYLKNINNLEEKFFELYKRNGGQE